MASLPRQWSLSKQFLKRDVDMICPISSSCAQPWRSCYMFRHVQLHARCATCPAFVPTISSRPHTALPLLLLPPSHVPTLRAVLPPARCARSPSPACSLSQLPCLPLLSGLNPRNLITNPSTFLLCVTDARCHRDCRDCGCEPGGRRRCVKTCTVWRLAHSSGGD